MNRVDVAIVGAGPAGISAAINCKIRNKSMILFGNGMLSDKVAKAELINNYPGLQGMSGAEFNAGLKEHLDSLEINITEEKVTQIYPMQDYFSIMTPDNQYEAKTVIMAVGVDAKRTIPGEKEFLGRGVSYCATCDGNLYRGRTIAVICEGESMEEEAEYLATLAAKTYFLPMYTKNNLPVNVEKISGQVQKIVGNDVVSGILTTEGEYRVDGVFFLKNTVSADILLPGLEAKDGHIVVDRDMATNIAGCFAAGDCTGTPYQIAKAVGEGNIAFHSALKLLRN